MSSRLLRAVCTGFCAAIIAVAASPAAKPDVQKAVTQKPDKKVARTPVGTVTADSPIRINGVGLDGATAWPIFEGDVIETYSTDAKLKMKDGHSALLRKLSAVLVSGALAAAALTVDRGSVALYDTGGNVTQLAPRTSGSLFTTPSGKASSAPRLVNWQCKDGLPKTVCSQQQCNVPSPPTDICCTWDGNLHHCAL